MAERDPTRRFADRADDYVRFRPSYPPGAIDAILEGLGDPGSLIVADVGAGTGISARLLAERGARVIAVEPNEAMRRAARAHERVQWRDGTGEATGLERASVDLVVCAQAYHWMDPPRACAEFARVLRPSGRLALMWNDGDESTPVAKAYYDLLRKVATDGTLSHKTAAAGPTLEAPFEAMRRLTFRNVQRLDEEGLIGRAMSASYVPKAGADAERLAGAITELHAKYAAAEGLIDFEYEVVIYLSENPIRAYCRSR